ncbi:DNA-processing protein DprA [Nitratifractor salsuginis]|uniref:SMF family protein n=1 Tax=Nitratifractor salsuginis (strain DSM 16511 / JCM 12458 / E9I37-1) TaxID=749222 RepID=E6WZZ3_NITSE|nr:DNA-processing protein DprA [Nitratifractor salsuginis]ADV45651.1 SMF family protein [Nitratifractor salsuginis DSM 16511]
MAADLLEELPAEFETLKKPPERLWYLGNPELLKRRKVSIVGTRRPSAYTREMTHRLAKELAARGVVVVSGAAMGVDAIAHQGAGPASTIAVLGTGVDLRYPAVNAPLIESIEKEGLLLSRFEPGMRATNWSFVVRNELVVALGEVLVITQADRQSGSMRSAEIAGKLGREIWVLPQRLGESEGTNDLLREGVAKPIYSIEEFADRFGTVPAKELPLDDFFYFCQKNPTVDEVLNRFGARLYEAELMGEVEIRDGRVRLA